MAQAFVTTYKNHYRWNNPVKPDPILPQGIDEILPDNDPDLWILPKKIVKTETDDQSTTSPEALVKRMQKRKFRTTYHVSYCRERKALHKEGEAGLEGPPENELMEYCKKLYEQKERPILPPLPTLRRVNGYIRRAKLYTPLTVYQNEFGRVGYNILNK